MSRTVVLHVGTAKSGTTYLQGILQRNRELLKHNGVLYPGSASSHFLASMDLRGFGFKGYDYPGTAGSWDRLVREVREFDGKTAVISHETLARTPPAVIDKAVSDFPDSDVRVLITCRDLGRQLPAAWQERVKNRNGQRYADFLDHVFANWSNQRTGLNSVFWRAQNLTGLARRWSRAVGAENVRLVTVPPAGADPDQLWKRFAHAVGLPELELDSDIAASNTSLGTVETELLRRLNPVLPEELTWPEYEKRIKRRFASKELAQRSSNTRLTVPERWRRPTEDAAARMIEHLRDSGYPVIGDLEDLRPSFRAEELLPDDLGADQLLERALEILATMAARRRPAIRPSSGREAARILVRKARNRLRASR